MIGASTYRFDTGITDEQLSDVFRLSCIQRPTDDMPRLKKMIDHADLIAEAWREEELVGVARVVTDFSYCAYISDLAVKKEWQGHRIGTGLLDRVKETLGDEVTLVLLSTPNAMDYYPKQGYEKADNAFRIMRKR